MLTDREGHVEWEDVRTWYRVIGDLSNDGPAPLVTLHGGPGVPHEYLLSMTDLATAGRAVVFYDQVGNGRSTHRPFRGADYFTVDLFVRELAHLIEHLGIGDRYHVLGQSWGGMLAQEHAITAPTGLQSVVLSNTAASFASFAVAANGLRAGLPAEVEATLRRHEADGTTDDPAYAEACDVYYARHLCRVDPWPDELRRSFALLEADPTVYHVTNGPSEFHCIGSFKDWSAEARLDRFNAPALVISGRYDEATPAVQETLVARLADVEQVLMEDSSHMPFWEERTAYMTAVGDFLARHD